MAEIDDALSREVAVSAKFDLPSISLKTQSRAIAALDRLLGSLMDMPAAFFEGISRRTRLKQTLYEDLKKAQVVALLPQIQGNPTQDNALINDLLKETARKQVNKAAIAHEAVKAMKAQTLTDTPEDENANLALTHVETDREGEAGQASQSFAARDETRLDEDWMNQFTRYAEDASSDQLQQVWGRVLAGEIHKPGSFSRRTLRFIAELDQETAENCEILARHVIQNRILFDHKWREHPLLMMSLEMRQLGIIEGGSLDGPRQHFKLNDEGQSGIAGKKWGLFLQGTPGATISFPVFVLTRLGKQVISLLNKADEANSLREIAKTLDKAELKSIELMRVTEKYDNHVTFTGTPEMLWTDPQGQKPSS